MKCGWCGKDTEFNVAEAGTRAVIQDGPAGEKPGRALVCHVHVGSPDIRQGVVCPACTKKAANAALEAIGKPRDLRTAEGEDADGRKVEG